jgi:hypothetical protein
MGATLLLFANLPAGGTCWANVLPVSLLAALGLANLGATYMGRPGPAGGRLVIDFSTAQEALYCGSLSTNEIPASSIAFCNRDILRSFGRALSDRREPNPS